MISQTGNLLDMFLRGSFFLLLLVYVITGLVLWYHWAHYASSSRIATLTLSVYVVGGLLCVTLMLPAILANL